MRMDRKAMRLGFLKIGKRMVEMRSYDIEARQRRKRRQNITNRKR